MKPLVPETSPVERTRSTTSRCGALVFPLTLLGALLCGSASFANHDLIVAAGKVFGNSTETSLYTLDVDTNTYTKVVTSKDMTLYPFDGFAAFSRMTTGGFGCPVFTYTGDSVVETRAGKTSTVLSAADGSVIGRGEITADDRFVFACTGSNAAGGTQLNCSKLDTFSGGRREFSVPIDVLPPGISQGALPDVHALGRNGNNYDAVLRYVIPGTNQEIAQVVRFDGVGNLLQTFNNFPGRMFIEGDWMDGKFYGVTRTSNATAWGVNRYNANSYTFEGTVLPVGTINSRQSFEVVGSRIIGYSADTGELRKWNRNTGADLGAIPLPAGENFFLAFTKATCTEDTTKIRIGPQRRFELSGQVTTFDNSVLPIQFPPALNDNSATGFFLDNDNSEFLVKVVDFCGLSQAFAYFLAATTNVGYELTIEDTISGQTKTISNPVGTLAAAQADPFFFTESCP